MSPYQSYSARPSRNYDRIDIVFTSGAHFSLVLFRCDMYFTCRRFIYVGSRCRFEGEYFTRSNMSVMNLQTLLCDGFEGCSRLDIHSLQRIGYPGNGLLVSLPWGIPTIQCHGDTTWGAISKLWSPWNRKHPPETNM